ncbi:HpcH/HpaI aldolase/citrate lyase family protein [Saccharothrix longispora]|uniref:Citrate lyase subunit beta/citryl-CoA lyase n=1 Tax=Saccharothrix longispora TaxID=33920 RepID=A0ABU1PTT4_9PSEU|nr:aldolase/citrate lyase family protein [Saccharothrix longispora]MDR6594068.1 citrate lyase subunit beta/citryl-CoA lyase [Saccharothrix longispora]
MTPPARSFLYVPGHREDRLRKAVDSDADAVVLDLEDAVPAADKERARRAVRALLAALPPGRSAWVRVNSDPDLAAEDVAAVASPALAGIWVPKAEPDPLRRADDLLTAAERRHHLPEGGLAVVPLVETALGVLRVEQVCAAPRVTRLGVGEADLAGELRLRPDDRRSELHGIRLQVVLASAAAGLEAPVGPVETDVRDTGRLLETTTTLLRQGFRARTALHPRQLATINAVFTPTEAEVAEAAALVEDFTGNAGVDRTGRFVDPAVLRAAHEVLARAGVPGAPPA